MGNVSYAGLGCNIFGGDVSEPAPDHIDLEVEYKANDNCRDGTKHYLCNGIPIGSVLGKSVFRDGHKYIAVCFIVQGNLMTFGEKFPSPFVFTGGSFVRLASHVYFAREDCII